MAYKTSKRTPVSQMATVPQSYGCEVTWLPRIGDVVPNFLAESTHGPIPFHAWAEGHGVFLFSHPAPFTPICTTELASFAAARSEFERRGVKLLGISSGSLEDQARWHADIERLYGIAVDIPMIGDQTGLLTNLFGMIHPEQSRDWTIRKSFIIGPDLKVKMIFEYPVLLGRSTDEVLRCIDGLQSIERFNVGVGADWKKGDECLLLPEALGPAFVDPDLPQRRVASYLRTIADPWSGREGAETMLAAVTPHLAAIG